MSDDKKTDEDLLIICEQFLSVFLYREKLDLIPHTPADLELFLNNLRIRTDEIKLNRR